MSGTGPGELNGEALVYRGVDVSARVELRDERVAEVIEVSLPRGQTGKKPGRLTGLLAIRFIEKQDAQFAAHLDGIVARERTHPMTFDVRFDDGRELPDSSVAGPLGGELGAFWFTLNLAP